MWKLKCCIYLSASDMLLGLARLALRIARSNNARASRLTDYAIAITNRARALIGGEDG